MAMSHRRQQLRNINLPRREYENLSDRTAAICQVPAAPCRAVRAGDHLKVTCRLKKSFLLSDRQRSLAPPLSVLAATWPALGYPNSETAARHARQPRKPSRKAWSTLGSKIPVTVHSRAEAR